MWNFQKFDRCFSIQTVGLSAEFAAFRQKCHERYRLEKALISNGFLQTKSRNRMTSFAKSLGRFSKSWRRFCAFCNSHDHPHETSQGHAKFLPWSIYNKNTLPMQPHSQRSWLVASVHLNQIPLARSFSPHPCLRWPCTDTHCQIFSLYLHLHFNKFLQFLAQCTRQTWRKRFPTLLATQLISTKMVPSSRSSVIIFTTHIIPPSQRMKVYHQRWVSK